MWPGVRTGVVGCSTISSSGRTCYEVGDIGRDRPIIPVSKLRKLSCKVLHISIFLLVMTSPRYGIVV